MSGRVRRWGWLAAILLAAGVAWAANGDAVEGRWVEVREGAIVATVEVEGELEAAVSSGVGPPGVPQVWNYKISFLAPEGAVVQAGQPVVGFDTTDLQRELQVKTGERDSAATELDKRQSELAIERADMELQLAEAESRLRRAELELAVPPDVVSRHELEAARIDHRLAEIEIAGLRTGLEHLADRAAAELSALRGRRDRAARRVSELEQNIAAMRVAAPRSGTVIYAAGRGREKRKVGDSVWRAETILEIPDLSHMLAVGEVDEASIGRLAPGQPVTLRLDAHPDMQWPGTLREVRRAVKPRSPGDPSRVVEVEIALRETDPERMRPGMRFRGEIEVARSERVLVLPLAAVEPGPEGPTVRVRRGLRVESVRPRLGRRDDERFEVLDGLAAGDRVLVAEEVEG